MKARINKIHPRIIRSRMSLGIEWVLPSHGLIEVFQKFKLSPSTIPETLVPKRKDIIPKSRVIHQCLARARYNFWTRAGIPLKNSFHTNNSP